MKHKTYAYYLVTGVHTFFVIKNPKNPTSGFPGFWRGTRDLSKCCAFAVHRLHIHCGSNTSLYKHPRCLYDAQALRLFARRAVCDPQGKTDSVAAGGGASISERCLFARRAVRRSVWQNGQRRRSRRSERQRTLPVLPKNRR